MKRNFVFQWIWNISQLKSDNSFDIYKTNKQAYPLCIMIFADVINFGGKALE